MTVTSIAEEPSSTRCTICARPARRGDRLCAQCKTAVKRARQVPSLQTALLPRVGAGAVASRNLGPVEGRSVPAPRAARSAWPALPAGWGTYATLVVFGAAVSITGYYATDQQDEAANRERGSQATRAATVMPMRNESGARTQPPLSSSAAADGSVGDEAIAQIEWTVPPTPPARLEGAPAGKKAPRDGRSAGTEALRPFDARDSYPELPPAPMDAPENVAASRAAPAPEAQAAATSDRRQVMAAALSRCERENFLGAFLCKERAWLQFCDGQWGEEPQCPSAVRSNSTR